MIKTYLLLTRNLLIILCQFLKCYLFFVLYFSPRWAFVAGGVSLLVASALFVRLHGNNSGPRDHGVTEAPTAATD